MPLSSRMLVVMIMGNAHRSMLDSVPGFLPSYLILTAALGERHCDMYCLTESAQRLSNVPKVTLLVSGGAEV